MASGATLRPKMRVRSVGRFARTLSTAVIVATATLAAAPSTTPSGPLKSFMDCERAGDEYTFTTDAGSAGVTAWVTDSAGTRVAGADVGDWFGSLMIMVPPDTSYAKVWVNDGTTDYSLDRVERDCNANFTTVSTPDYGPGLVPMSPVRVHDTRESGDRLRAGGTLAVQIAGAEGVPADATAAMVNITAVGPSGDGHLTAYPCDRPRPTASMANYVSGETRAGASLIQLDGGGKLCVYSHAAADVVIDVQGSISGSQNPVPIVPTRVLDTRTGGGQVDGKRTLTFGDYSQLQLPFDPGGYGEEVAGLFINLTTVGADEPGYVTVYPAADRLPTTTSRLNFVAGRAQSNMVFATLDSAGIVINTTTTTDVIVDVVAVARHPDRWAPMPDFRLFDTRADADGTTDGRFEGTGQLQPGVPQSVQVGGRLGPLQPTAVLVNVTTVAPVGETHVTVYPCGDSPPLVSNANAAAGQVVANAALVPLDEFNAICVVSPVATDLVIDIMAAMTTNTVGLTTPGCVYPSLEQGYGVVGGQPPYVLSGTLPEGFGASYGAGRFDVVGDDPFGASFARTMYLTDAAGRRATVSVYNWGYGLVVAPRLPCNPPWGDN